MLKPVFFLYVGVFVFLGSSLFAGSREKELARLFFSDPEVKEARLTPGNRGISYLSGAEGRTSLRLLDLTTGKTRRAFAESGADIYDHYWLDRDSVLVFAQKLGIPFQVFVINFNLGGHQLSEFHRVYDTLPDMKNVYLAKEGRVTIRFPDLYRVNAYTGSKTKVASNPGNIISWLTDKDGLPRIRYYIDENEIDCYEYRSNEGEEWRSIDIDGHPLSVLFLENAPEQFIIFIRRNGHDKFKAFRFDAERNEYIDTVLSDTNYDILPTEYLIDPENEASFGFRYSLAKPKNFWLDEAFAQAQARIDTLHPDTINNIAGRDQSSAGFVYRRFSDRLPGEWWRFDPHTKKNELLLVENPLIEPTEMVNTEVVAFPARDGTTIHGYLTKAPDWDGQPGKTILMIHGGPRARDYWEWDREAQYFAALGYSVLKVNYRGSSGYGLEYSPYYHYSSMLSSVSDTIDATKWLIAEGVAKPKAVAIYGSSFGGHVALSCVADAPELFACAIGYAGVYNWPEEVDADFKEEPVYATLKKHTYYGDFDNEREKWRAASAITKVDQIKCPVLLIHGRSDDIVSSTQSRRMRKAMKKAQKDVQLKILSFNAHGLAQEKNRINFYMEIAEFLGEKIP